MSNLSSTFLVGQMVKVSWPGVPAPNSGVTFVSKASSVEGIIFFGDQTATYLNIRGSVAGTTEVTIVTQNAVGLQFTDTISIKIMNSVPDATGSGLTISDPQS